MVLQYSKLFYSKVSSGFLRQDSQSSYIFRKILNVGDPELSEEKKISVSLARDFIFRFHIYLSASFAFYFQSSTEPLINNDEQQLEDPPPKKVVKTANFRVKATNSHCLESSAFQTGLGRQSRSKYYKQKNHYHETFLVNFNFF